MNLVYLPFVLFAVPPENEAEKMFRAMEQKLASAKTLQLSFSVVAMYEGKVAIAQRGSLIIAEGNKARLTMESDVRLVDAQSNIRMISDGKKMKVENFSKGNRLNAEDSVVEISKRDTPKFLKKNITCLVSLGLASMAVPIHFDDGLDNQDIQRSKDWPTASEFKLGKREKVGGREAQVIEFKFKLEDDAHMAVWIDRATMLPLKYSSVGAAKDQDNQSVVTQTDIRVDEKLDSKLFELDAPKK